MKKLFIVIFALGAFTLSSCEKEDTAPLEAPKLNIDCHGCGGGWDLGGGDVAPGDTTTVGTNSARIASPTSTPTSSPTKSPAKAPAKAPAKGPKAEK